MEEFDAMAYPMDEYIEVEDNKIAFPEKIHIAFAVCSKKCNHAEFIVDGSTQVCQYCGKLMFRTEIKEYYLRK